MDVEINNASVGLMAFLSPPRSLIGDTDAIQTLSMHFVVPLCLPEIMVTLRRAA
jgi:hypothetical protein